MIERLGEIIEAVEGQWSSKRLLVVGDVMLDKYIAGSVARISPEAPVPVVLATERSHQPGGAANVALNLARLGAQVEVIGFTGGDEDEQLLRACLRGDGIVEHLLTSEGFPTITKTRILGGRQQMLRLDSERLGERPQADQARLLQTLLARIAECDALVLSDYAKGALTAEVCGAAIAAARARGIPVLVDPKSLDFARYAGATTICPNLTELARAAHAETQDLDALLERGEAMAAALHLEFLTVTLSEKGIALVRKGQRRVAPAAVRQVFDVSGAGDTVIAVLALSLASGLGAETGIELANLAAGVVVGKVGTAPIDRHELLAALAPAIGLHAEEKVVTREALVSRAALWRQSGDRVVLTNGCFDLLHVGHIAVIEQARSFGQRLIVAINSDASVARLKGPSRPIVGQAERARVLAALGAVDAVVIFDEDTPLELVLAVRPDVLVKGGNYQPETVVGAAEVAGWGGRLELVPMVEGFSTTRLIEKGKA